MKRASFLFKREYYEALLFLPMARRAEVFDAICEYALYGKEQLLKGHSLAAFRLIQPIIDKEVRKSEEGRRCAEYKEWRTKVFVRDHYTCAVCGARGVRLNAHHIKSYANSPELRYELSNGVTLCEYCHKEAHRQERGVRDHA